MLTGPGNHNQFEILGVSTNKQKNTSPSRYEGRTTATGGPRKNNQMGIIKAAKKTMTGGFKLAGPGASANPNATATGGGSTRWNGFYPTKYKS